MRGADSRRVRGVVPAGEPGAGRVLVFDNGNMAAFLHATVAKPSRERKPTR